jgi:hypothetical protein
MLVALKGEKTIACQEIGLLLDYCLELSQTIFPTEPYS